MSQYTKTTNFATKDNLSPGNPLKIVKGTEIDTEFNNIATAVATKTDNSAAAITGGSITGITDLAVADGGTGASTAAGALNNLLPSQTSAANKYLQSDGTNASWDAVSLSTADITGTLAVANGGTGVTSSTGTGAVVLSNSPTLVTPALGTPASGTATNLTGLPISTGVSGLGTGVATFLGTPSSANLASAVTDETGSGALVFANSPTLVTPALGTPSALVGTNITGTASGLTAGNVTTNANLTGAVTSVGNATSLGSFSSANLLGALTDETGTGSAVFATSPTLVTPILGTPTSATLTNATGLPISTGVSGLGTGVATALAVNVGSSGAPLVNGGVLGTPSSGTATNLTGLPLSTGVTGTLPVANGGTGTATPSIVAGTNVTVTGTWPNQTIAASGGGTPGGSTTQVQYNNAGAFGGITGATSNGTALTLVAPVLGTPASATLTNATGLPLSTGVTGTLPVANGGTGQTSYTDGQLLIGNSTGNTLTKATLTAGTNVTITNAAGAITIAASGGGASAATPTVEGTVYGKMTASGGTPFLTALGYNAGVNTTGTNNTAVGISALTANTSGTQNVAVGNSALATNTSNSFSTAVGYQALTAATGGQNTAVGRMSMLGLTTGTGNTGVGVNSLYTASTGGGNVAIGDTTLFDLTTGSNNVAVGNYALQRNTTADNNTAMGYQSLNANTTASSNTAVGYRAAYSNTTGVQITALGNEAAKSGTTANYITAIGHNTLISNTTGSDNIAVGASAMEGNTTGNNNVSVGDAALLNNTTGGSNTAIGQSAGWAGGTNANTTGSNNTFIGNGAVGSSSTASNVITLGNSSIATLRCQQTSITSLSDRRDKSDIVDIPAGMNFIQQLRPVSFKWHMRDGAKIGISEFGFIAQELQDAQVASGITVPNLVSTENPDKLEASQGTLIPILVKAIQELKAEFDAYKATHP